MAERGSWRTDLVGEAERLWGTGGEVERQGAILRWWMAAEQGLEVAQNNLAYVLDQRKRARCLVPLHVLQTHLLLII